MRLARLPRAVLALAAAALGAGLLPWAGPAMAQGPGGRVAVVSAFEPELGLLKARLKDARTERIHGVDFTSGELEGRPVLLFLSGISMTNAAMTTQMALDRFRISHVVFSGIAGGVNPALHVGDVVVPERWSSYLEALYAREVAPGRFQPPGWMAATTTTPPFGMAYPRPVEVRSARAVPQPELKTWFEVDAGMLAAARALKDTRLDACAAEAQCLQRTPRLVVGGAGVSGSAFVDNAAFRDYTFKTFGASVLDMESAAVAQVAYANGVPFLAFRSLSDLAGGGEGENEVPVFLRLAANNSAQVLLAFLRQWKP